MPLKKITIPAAIQLVDPSTGAMLPPPDGILTFEAFLDKLMTNPLWGEHWKAAMAQQSIRAAFKALPDGQHDLSISEDDWVFLDTAAKQPRMTVYLAGGGATVISGLGLHPSLAGQVVPMQLAVINAETV